MKKIIEIEKKTKSYLVRFNEELVSIEPEIYLKFHLRLQQEFEDKEYAKLIKENEYVFYDKLGIIRLKRMQTSKELKDYLLSKGAHETIAKQLITKYTERKYLDDYTYAKLYVQLKQDSEGPQLIFNHLKEKGISNEIIEGFTKKIDEHSILEHLIPKKLKSIKNKSKKQAIQTLKGFCLRKGFSLETVDAQIKKALVSYDIDELELIKKEYAKLQKKYQSKTRDNFTNYNMIQKLYAKGFKIEDIKKVIH
ncbi:MAG: RecX family transcriptional regulator [Bacillota bacterium]